MSAMKRVLLAAAMLSATALTVAGSASAFAAAPARPSASHVLKLTLTGVQLAQSGAGAYTESATLQKGANVYGYGAFSCTLSGAKARCAAAFALPGGVLDGTFTISAAAGTYRGTLGGGTGSYAKAKGTITGRASGSTSTLTLTY